MKVDLDDLRKVPGIGPKTIQRIRKTLLDNNKNYVSKYNPDKHLEKNEIYLGDCLELMNGIPDKSIDMVLADLPYGTTACSWDSVIDLEKLWLQYERVIKDNGAMVFTASQPFTTELISSNLDLFKYALVWEKSRAADFLNANYRPMKKHEDILIFSKAGCSSMATIPMIYNPQGVEYKEVARNRTAGMGINRDRESQLGPYTSKGSNYPVSIIKVSSEANTVHPTQKPVKLFEYLIKTYTNPGDVILDNVIGSGTTAIAAINTGRDFIGIEKEEKYYKIAKERIRNAISTR